MFHLLAVFCCILFSFLSFTIMDYWLNPKPFFKTIFNDFQHKIFVFFLSIIGCLLATPVLIILVKKIMEGDIEAYFFASFYLLPISFIFISYIKTKYFK